METRNKKMEHLLSLLALCERIQHRLLSKGRSIHNDYVIVNLFNLVSQYPFVPISVVLKVYRRLLKHSWAGHDIIINLNENENFMARSLLSQK